MPLVLLKGILLSLLGLERPPFLLTLSAGGLLERRLLVLGIERRRTHVEYPAEIDAAVHQPRRLPGRLPRHDVLQCQTDDQQPGWLLSRG